MTRERRIRPEWFEHQSIRALFALERVWAGQALKTRVGAVRVWMLPDPSCAHDEHEAPVVTLARRDGDWHGALRAEWACLPFSDASVSQLVVQHVLDDAENASALLGECARVLAMDGELLLFGLNPAGLARLRLGLSTRRPTRIRLPGRLRASLGRLGLVVAPPLGVGGGVVEAVSAPRRWLRAAYVLRARKRVAQVIPLSRVVPKRVRAMAQLAPTQCAESA
jgi:hypothetical protein